MQIPQTQPILADHQTKPQKIRLKLEPWILKFKCIKSLEKYNLFPIFCLISSENSFVLSLFLLPLSLFMVKDSAPTTGKKSRKQKCNKVEATRRRSKREQRLPGDFGEVTMGFIWILGFWFWTSDNGFYLNLRVLILDKWQWVLYNS